VRRLDEAAKIEKGDVLVTVFTDPGWTPLLGRVAAVVTETGGVLSHAAVISREYGIPAVLAVPHATTVLRDGQRVIVDGTNGIVDTPPA
ncbi:MAG: PEP-utilizing enzyme, partial [Planctomycetota bacterium]